MIQACPGNQLCGCAGLGAGRYRWHPEYLGEHLFWISHLGLFFRDLAVQDLLIGPDRDAADEFCRAMRDAGDWPVFTVQLPKSCRVDAVCRHGPDGPDTYFVLHDPEWGHPTVVASRVDGVAPALSWDEANSGDGPQLLLLLPIVDFETLPADASEVLASALRQFTVVEEPYRLAERILTTGPGWSQQVALHRDR